MRVGLTIPGLGSSCLDICNTFRRSHARSVPADSYPPDQPHAARAAAGWRCWRAPGAERTRRTPARGPAPPRLPRAARPGERAGDGARPRRRRRRAVQPGRDDGDPLHRAHRDGQVGHAYVAGRDARRRSWPRWSMRCCRTRAWQSRMLARGDRTAGRAAAGAARRDARRRRRQRACSSSPCGTCAHERRTSHLPVSPIRSAGAGDVSRGAGCDGAAGTAASASANGLTPPAPLGQRDGGGAADPGRSRDAVVA